MASPTHYPTFRRRTLNYYHYLVKRKKDLVQINGITDPELTQLNDLLAALEVVATGAGWPEYREAR